MQNNETLKLNPNIKDKTSSAEPPIKHFKAVMVIMSFFMLRNLLRLLSIPQKKQAPTTSRFPKRFWVSVSWSNEPFVVTKTTPMSSMRIPIYSLFEQRSFRNAKAMATVNSDSAFRSRDELIALV